KELSIVGLPQREGGEIVAALVVPDYEAEAEADGREAVRAGVREHMKQVSQRLPLYKRVKVFHLWDHDLPKTSTRKPKRREAVAELERLEAVARAARGPAAGDAAVRKPAVETGASSSWVREVLASVTQRPLADVEPDRRLAELGFDSLMFTELGVALEAAGLEVPDPGELNTLETVADAEAFCGRLRRRRE